MSANDARIKAIVPGACVTLAVIALDRLSKLWAMKALPGKGLLGGIPGIFGFHYAENTGAAFSALSGHNALLITVTAVLIAGILLMLFTGRIHTPALRVGLFLIAGGGVGNLIDRAIYGSVIDFIELRFISFAVFNVADAAICLGAAVAVIGTFLSERRKKTSEDVHG